MNFDTLSNLFNYFNNSHGIYNDIYTNNHRVNNNNINNQETNNLNNELNSAVNNELSNRSVVVERHVIPADLYHQWYIQPNVNRPANRLSTSQNQNQTNNDRLTESLNNSLYGRRNTSTNQTDNNTTDNNITDNNTTTSSTSNVDASRMFSNMRFIVRDSNGNRVDYNMSTPSSNTEINQFSSLLDRLINPNTQLNELFSDTIPRETVLTTQQINDNTTIRRYTTNRLSDDEVDSDTTDEEECSICRDSYIENNELRMINNCGHEFHISCIDEWLSSNSTCPICRGGIV